MSEIMKVDDDNITELKSPSLGAADEFFDAVDDGKNFHNNNNHRCIVAVYVCLALVANITFLVFQYLRFITKNLVTTLFILN